MIKRTLTKALISNRSSLHQIKTMLMIILTTLKEKQLQMLKLWGKIWLHKFSKEAILLLRLSLDQVRTIKWNQIDA